MEINFRKATIEDVENIINLVNECFGENNSLEYALESFKKTENDPNQIYLVGVVEDNKIVAHTKITIIPTMYEDEGMQTFSILNHVCVKPDYRRHNFATKMLDEITKICQENNCTKMKLWSKNFRQPAHACYMNYGFEVIDAKFFEKAI